MDILIAEDDLIPRRMLQKALSGWGYNVISAVNGEEAWQILQRADAPKFAILDWMMPLLDGVEICQRLREINPAEPTYVILLSGRDAKEDLVAGLHAGANDYIIKPFDIDELRARVGVGQNVVELQSRLAARVSELDLANRVNENLLAAISSVLISLDREGRILRWNHAAADTFGLAESCVLGKKLSDCGILWRDPGVNERILQCFDAHHSNDLPNQWFTDSKGSQRLFSLIAHPVFEGKKDAKGLLLLGADVTEQKLLEEELRRAQRLESIGQLAAGIAHEINTPIQYIGDNTRFVRDSFKDIVTVVRASQRVLTQSQSSGQIEGSISALADALENADTEYLIDELPAAMEQTLEGVANVARIVRAMKEFSHPGGEGKTAMDVNHALENTITVARNEWKYAAKINTSFTPDLPAIPAYPGELNQVFLNLIVNAAHAIESATNRPKGSLGTITIGTHRTNSHVEVRVTDTGCGIPEKIRSRVFDPFFTTKQVGKGTGQGLAIAHAVVVKKHNGSICFETQVGVGTTFIVRLPIAA